MAVDKINHFLDEIAEWAATRAEIQAVALVGSHARGTAGKDSDIDLILITDEPNDYLSDIQWIQQFGIIEKKQIEHYGLVTSVRVWYGNGLEVEFGITDQRWTALPIDPGTRTVIMGGFRVLFERGNILNHLLSAK
jgi:predicted nucleotidyltransferase